MDTVPLVMPASIATIVMSTPIVTSTQSHQHRVRVRTFCCVLQVIACIS